ncbi:MAG: hypothetical protein HOI23_06205 [Deltaproteobacteria bacterium]|nr:hypothetical protein [Deltaproteobacteria bacterium]MBT6432886.1 hypothetical protein [Deltaproteobacteria bacterium]MBT6489887.1 hypothetical protein [Deltaproteobacteria bacterium]
MKNQRTIQMRKWAIRIVGASILCASAVCGMAKEPNLSNYSSRRKEVVTTQTESEEQTIIAELSGAI